MLLTFETSQSFRGWLKLVALQNISRMSVTFETSHPLISALKPLGLRWGTPYNFYVYPSYSPFYESGWRSVIDHDHKAPTIAVPNNYFRADAST